MSNPTLFRALIKPELITKTEKDDNCFILHCKNDPSLEKIGSKHYVAFRDNGYHRLIANSEIANGRLIKLKKDPTPYFLDSDHMECFSDEGIIHRAPSRISVDLDFVEDPDAEPDASTDNSYWGFNLNFQFDESYNLAISSTDEPDKVHQTELGLLDAKLLLQNLRVFVDNLKIEKSIDKYYIVSQLVYTDANYVALKVLENYVSDSTDHGKTLNKCIKRLICKVEDKEAKIDELVTKLNAKIKKDAENEIKDKTT